MLLDDDDVTVCILRRKNTIRQYVAWQLDKQRESILHVDLAEVREFSERNNECNMCTRVILYYQCQNRSHYVKLLKILLMHIFLINSMCVVPSSR